MIISSTKTVYRRRYVHSWSVIIAATIVFDFDGTVAVGLGPVLAYARHVAEAAPHAAFLSDLTAELVAAERDRRLPDGVLDGYDLVRRRAEAAGVGAARMEAAYAASREELGTVAAPVAAPDGLPALLAALGACARVVLVTNAPGTGIATVLDALGLRDRFDEVHASAGKPDGLGALAERWLAAGPLLSVGDIWANDLEPVHALGGDTALVGAAPPGAAPTLRGDTLPDLYPALLRWAGAAHDPTSSPLLRPDLIPSPETEPHT